jgi:hypothetical protein
MSVVVLLDSNIPGQEYFAGGIPDDLKPGSTRGIDEALRGRHIESRYPFSTCEGQSKSGYGIQQQPDVEFYTFPSRKSHTKFR